MANFPGIGQIWRIMQYSFGINGHIGSVPEVYYLPAIHPCQILG